MTGKSETSSRNLRRNVLVLLFALGCVVGLTAVIILSRPSPSRLAGDDVREQERARAYERAMIVGKQHLRGQRYAEARSSFLEARGYRQDDAEALRGVGLASLMIGQHRDAERYLASLVKIAPDDVRSYRDHAIAQFVQGDFDGAEATVRRGFAATDPSQHRPLYLILATMSQLEGKQALADTYLGQASRLEGGQSIEEWRHFLEALPGMSDLRHQAIERADASRAAPPGGDAP